MEQAVWVSTLVMGLLLVREGMVRLSRSAAPISTGGRLAIVLAAPRNGQRTAQAQFLKRRYGLRQVAAADLVREPDGGAGAEGTLVESIAADQPGLLASLASRRDLATPVFIEIADRSLGGPKLDAYLIFSYYPDADIWTFDGTRPPEAISDTLRRLLDPVARPHTSTTRRAESF